MEEWWGTEEMKESNGTKIQRAACTTTFSLFAKTVFRLKRDLHNESVISWRNEWKFNNTTAKQCSTHTVFFLSHPPVILSGGKG